MICRLIKNIIISVLVTVGLTACIQGGGASSDPALGVSSTANGGRPGYTHVNSHSNTRRGVSSSGVILNTSFVEPPASYSQMMGTGGSLWDRLRTNFQLPPADNRPQVQAQINWFVHNQSYLDRTIRRAAPYMYLIFQETQSRNLPAELVLLPIMESAYNPFIRSSRGAVGLWQLMSGTASGFGVKQDFWYDGRRDVYASTNAALDYLTYLQSYFGGDWLLAIAAYDAGEGRLQSAVHHNAERGLSTDFWSLSLPVETQAYVPRLLALAAIIQNPGKYNVALPPITDQPYLQQVDLGAPINLTQAADMAGMSLAELKALNPGYSRTSTGPNGPYRLLLPIDRIPMFKERLAAMPAITKTTWGRYKVQRGDTLNIIAERFDTTVAQLRNANHLKGSHVPVGRVIMIPVGTEQVTPHIYDLATGQKTPLTAENVVEQAANVAASQAPETSTVTENTTVAAATSTTTVATQANNTATATQQSAVSDEEIDQAATHTAEQATAQKDTEEKVYHVIKHGETLSMIARHYGVSVDELTRWNKARMGKVLKPGTRLIIYRNSSNAGATKQEKSSVPHRAASAATESVGSSSTMLNNYTVRPGDTLLKIAHEQGVSVDELKRINHLKSNALRNGQVLKVPQPEASSAVADEDTKNTHAAGSVTTKQVVHNEQASSANKKSTATTHASAKVTRYTVRAGDNLIRIANRYNVKVASLKKWNHLADNAMVKPGQKLVIYTD
jgi:membrane-bound lytic murein transglycosylase D